MSDLNLRETQLEHAGQIVEAVRRRGLPRRQAVIALEAALTDSMWTSDDPAVPEVSAEQMDVELSTAAFLSELARQDLAEVTNWQAAQAVQRSPFADGSTYRVNDAWAGRIVAELWPDQEPDAEPSPLPAESAASTG